MWWDEETRPDMYEGRKPVMTTKASHDPKMEIQLVVLQIHAVVWETQMTDPQTHESCEEIQVFPRILSA